MINNFDKIKPLLKFDDTNDTYYFLQILQRKNKSKVNKTRLIKTYTITSLEKLTRYEDEIIELCKLFDARAMINLNRRSFKFSSLEMLVRLALNIKCNNYNNSRIWDSISGTYYPNQDKSWLLDLDNKDEEIIKTLEKELPDNIIVDIIPSKSGWHIITKPFNLKEFEKILKELSIEVHRNNPTNLYIP